MTLPKFVIVAALMSGTATNAAITVYTDQASFLAAVSAPGVDTFDDLSIDATPGPLSRTAGAYDYTATVGSVSVDFFPGSDDGSDIFLSTNNRFDTITLAGFATSVRAAGGFFFGSDLSGFSTTAASITINVTDADGTISEIALNPDTGTFRGFLSTGSLLSLSFLIGNQAGVWPSLNNLTLATVPGVPEPMAWTLMIGGFGMVGAAMRRRAVLTA